MEGSSEPPATTMRAVLELACRAPSLHNSQPWRWRIGPRSVRLYSDRTRLPEVLDPEGRNVVISCGAALHLARLGFAAKAWRVRTQRLPNPDEPDLLASMELGWVGEIDSESVILSDVASNRRTDRRPFLPDPVPEDLLTTLRDTAASEGATLEITRSALSRQRLECAIRLAEAVQREDPDYRQALVEWTRAHVTAEGEPIHSIPESNSEDFLERQLGHGGLAMPVLDDRALLAVLSTPADDTRSRLVAGEALNAVLVAAAREGLATCPLSQIGEVATARDDVRDEVLGGRGLPQIALRLGWPITEALPASATPRRPLWQCVDTLFPPV